MIFAIKFYLNNQIWHVDHRRYKVQCLNHNDHFHCTHLDILILKKIQISGILKVRLDLQQRAKQTDFLPLYDIKLVVFKRVLGLLKCCHALG